MNAGDLSTLAGLLKRSRAVVQQLDHLVKFGGDPTPLAAQLDSLEEQIGRLTWAVAQREAVSWGRPDH